MKIPGIIRHALFAVIMATSAAMMIMLPKGLSAQESLMEIPFLKSTESIIRMIDNDDWLVCCNDTCWKFARVNPASGNVEIKSLDSYIVTVTDFEIHEGRVYFCGMSSDGMPYMANFPLASFLSTNFECEFLDGASSVNKLDVYGSSNTVIHVVMTGQNLSGYGMLVEAMTMAVGWQVYYTLVYGEKGEKFIFDDIAISDSIAAITTHERSEDEILDPLVAQTYTLGRVWFITIPPINYPLVGYPVMEYVDVPYTIRPPFLVRETEPNSFVIAALGEHNTSNNVFVSGFIGKNHYATATLPFLFSPKDLYYNPSGRTTDIILNHIKEYVPNSVIYTLLPGMATTPGLAYGHIFNNYYWNSLVHLSYNPNHYICVGYPNTSPNIVSIAQYHCNYVASCSKQVEVITGILEWTSNAKRGDKYTITEYLANTYKKSQIKYKTLETLCFKRYTENE